MTLLIVEDRMIMILPCMILNDLISNGATPIGSLACLPGGTLDDYQPNSSLPRTPGVDLHERFFTIVWTQ